MGSVRRAQEGATAGIKQSDTATDPGRYNGGRFLGSIPKGAYGLDWAITMTAHASLSDFLRDPASYPEGGSEVRLIETDDSWVALVGETAYKIHRSAKREDSDLSTPELREKALMREMRGNRRLGGDIYREVLPIYQGPNGLSWQGSPPAVEYALSMRRLPDDRMLPQVLSHGGPSADEIASLVDLLAEFYESAKPTVKGSKTGRPDLIESSARQWLATAGEEIGSTPDLTRLEAALLLFLATDRDLFEQRIAKGKVVEGHGNLRVEDVCVTSPPIVLGGAESRDRTADLLFDLAALLNDLDVRGRLDVSRTIWPGVAARLEEPVESSLVSFYRALRALAQARRDALHMRDEETRKRSVSQWIEWAQSQLPGFYRPRLIVVFGLMGTGKTTLAEALAGELGLRRRSSEEVSRTLFPNTREGKVTANRLDAQQSDQVYRELAHSIHQDLREGISLVVDASFLHASHRQMIVELALELGIAPLFLECRLSKSDTIARLDRRFKKNRTRPGSRPELYEDQAAMYEAPDELPAGTLQSLNMNQPVPRLVEIVREQLS